MLQIKPLLCNLLALLYREAQLQDPGTNSKKQVRDTLNEFVKVADMNLDVDLENRVLNNIRALIIRMSRDPTDKVYVLEEIRNDIRVACEHDTVFYDILYDYVRTELTPEELSRTIVSLQQKVARVIQEEKLRRFISDVSRKINFQPDTIDDMEEYVGTVAIELADYQSRLDKKQNKSILQRVSADNFDSLLSVVEDAVDELTGVSIIPTPYKWLNDMLAGGWRRGQTHTVASLTHRYKTGLTLDSFIGGCCMADPMNSADNPDKVQVFLLVVAEDTMPTTMSKIFYRLFMHFEGRYLSDKEVEKFTPQFIGEYIHEKLTMMGWRYMILKVDPTECTFLDVRDMINGIEAEGCEIQWMAIDYLNMLSKKGCRQGPTGTDIQDLFNKVRTICTVKNIALLTPHQLSPDAENIERDLPETQKQRFVDIISSGSFYAGTRSVAKEVDCELFTHIAEYNGVPHLFIRRGKHRLPKQTPQVHLKAIAQFTDRGILFDYGSEYDHRITKLGANVGDTDSLEAYLDD